MRQEIQLGSQNFPCSWGVGQYMQEFRGEALSVLLRTTYVTRPWPLHKITLSNLLKKEQLRNGKEHKPKLGSGLPHEGVGAKKFGTSLETGEIKLFFWQDIPGFCWDIPAVPEKFGRKKLVFNVWPLTAMRETNGRVSGNLGKSQKRRKGQIGTDEPKWGSPQNPLY